MPDTIDYTGLLSLAGEISRESHLEGLLLQILGKSLPWMRVEACSIFLPDEETGDLVIHSAQGDKVPQLGALRVPAGQGIVGVAMTGCLCPRSSEGPDGRVGAGGFTA